MRRWIAMAAAAAVLATGWTVMTHEEASAARCRRYRSTYRSCRTYTRATTRRRYVRTYRTVPARTVTTRRWVQRTPQPTTYVAQRTTTPRWIDVTHRRRAAPVVVVSAPAPTPQPRWIDVTHRTAAPVDAPAPAPSAVVLGGGLSVSSASTCFT